MILGNIGENKLLLITSVKIMDEYFETKKKVDQKKIELKIYQPSLKSLKSLVYDYKEKKEKEIESIKLQDHEDFKKEIEKNKKNYEKMIEEATEK